MSNKIYLGEQKLLSTHGTPFEDFTKEDWALKFISDFGQFDGEHHKAWVLDHVAQILLGTEVEVSLAKWSDNTENYVYRTAKPSDEYTEWLISMMGEINEDGEFEYDYNPGVAP